MQDMENKRDTQMSEQPEEQTASEAAQTEEETAAAEETAETEQTAEEQPQTAENKLNKWLPAAMGYGIFFGALAIAIAIGLLVCLL